MSNETKIVHDNGYGIIKRSIMRNQKLSIEAKAIYSYLVSFAGTHMKAYPSIKLMCKELNISEKRFHKYKNELIEAGHLTIERERTENGFSNNIYILHDEAVTVQNVPLQNVTLQNVTLQNGMTNNNSINNNSINNNNINTTTTTNRTNNINSAYHESNSSSSGGVDEEFKELINKWHGLGFGAITERNTEMILDWLNKYDKDLISEVINYAHDMNIKNSRYVNAILKRLQNDNITTREQFIADTNSYNQKDKKSSQDSANMFLRNDNYEPSEKIDLSDIDEVDF